MGYLRTKGLEAGFSPLFLFVIRWALAPVCLITLAPQEKRTYFLTASTARRLRIFQVEAKAQLFIEILFLYRDQGRYELHEFVVMPDHIHLLLTPAPEVSLEKAMQLIKGGFSFRLKSKMDVWERSYFNKRVPDAQAYEATVRYIHQNPVKAGIVASAKEYPFSSATSAIVDRRPEWFA